MAVDIKFVCDLCADTTYEGHLMGTYSISAWEGNAEVQQASYDMLRGKYLYRQRTITVKQLCMKCACSLGLTKPTYFRHRKDEDTITNPPKSFEDTIRDLMYEIAQEAVDNDRNSR